MTEEGQDVPAPVVNYRNARQRVCVYAPKRVPQVTNGIGHKRITMKVDPENKINALRDGIFRVGGHRCCTGGPTSI